MRNIKIHMERSEPFNTHMLFIIIALKNLHLCSLSKADVNEFRECWVKDGCTINKAHLKEKRNSEKKLKSSNSLLLNSR